MRADTSESTATRSLGSTTGRIARALEREFSPGDVAALRRLNPSDPACATFWKLSALYLEDAFPTAKRTEAERRWAAILSAMAQLRGLHSPGRPLGDELAKSGFSELRFLRLLRAHEAALHDSVRSMSGFLASKAVSVDQTDIARLVLSDGRSDEEDTRRALARRFYTHVDRN